VTPEPPAPGPASPWQVEQVSPPPPQLDKAVAIVAIASIEASVRRLITAVPKSEARMKTLK
jgi:hypothetical protein